MGSILRGRDGDGVQKIEEPLLDGPELRRRLQRDVPHREVRHLHLVEDARRPADSTYTESPGTPLGHVVVTNRMVLSSLFDTSRSSPCMAQRGLGIERRTVVISTRRGLLMSVRAIATRCFMPPERSFGNGPRSR